MTKSSTTVVALHPDGTYAQRYEEGLLRTVSGLRRISKGIVGNCAGRTSAGTLDGSRQ